MTKQNHQACVWATSRDEWDSFLNDPELAQAIENARNDEPEGNKSKSQTESETAPSGPVEDDNQHRIGARLRAYETPITDEILRQSIR